MPRPCSVCAHASRLAIHEYQRRGATYEALSAEFGVSKSSISRHFNRQSCLERIRAEECPPGAAQRAPGAILERPEPAPLRRRAIASRPTQAVQPVALSAAPIRDFAPSLIPETVAREKPKPVTIISADEFALLRSLEYSPEKIAELSGLGLNTVTTLSEKTNGHPSSLFDVSNQTWAKHFVRLDMERIISLRRRQQAAEDDLRFPEVERYDAKIAAAVENLYRTLTRFGLAGPIDPAELGEHGDDTRDILSMIRNSIEGRFEPPQKRRRLA